MHKVPRLRRAVNWNGVLTTSRSKLAQYAIMDTWNLRLERSYDLKHNFHFFCFGHDAETVFNNKYSALFLDVVSCNGASGGKHDYS
jgi:hypothetical protein